MSFKPEVKLTGANQWNGNGLRFATKEEADDAALDLSMRWDQVEDVRVTISDDPVSHRWHRGHLERV